MDTVSDRCRYPSHIIIDEHWRRERHVLSYIVPTRTCAKANVLSDDYQVVSKLHALNTDLEKI